MAAHLGASITDRDNADVPIDVGSSFLAALLAGITLGSLAAAVVGPIWLLCVRTATRYGWWPGAAVGLGAATIGLAYAAMGALGGAAVLELTGLRTVLGLAGACVLAWLGVRTIRTAWRIRAGLESPDEVVTPAQALRTGLVATASNPVTILTWAAVFTSASSVGLARGISGACGIVLGIALGSLLVHAVLATLGAAAGRRMSPRVLAITDLISGLGIMAFAGVLGWRTLQDRA